MIATPFSRLVVSSGLSNLADGMFVVALPLVTLTVTRDPAAFAAVTFVNRLPWLLFALPAGALADRLDRRRTMLLVNVGRAALLGALALAVALDVHGLAVLYLVAFALGVGETLFDTAAQSIVPNLVPKDRLTRANGRLYAVELTTNQFVGPPLGGILVAVGAALALGASAAAYAFAAVVLLLISGSFRTQRQGPPTRLRTDIAEGVRYLARHRVLRTLALCTGLSNLASTAVFAVLPIYAVAPGPMGLSEPAFGLLLVSSAVGSLVASFAGERVVNTLGRTRTLLLSMVFPIWLPLAPALSARPAPFAVGLALAGFWWTIWNIITVSLRQRIAPDHLLGRVNAGYRLLAWGTMPVGAALGGVVGSVFGVRGVFWTSAILMVACIPLLLSAVDDQAIDAAEAESESETDAAAGDEAPVS
jgi:MFS family permease